MYHYQVREPVEMFQLEIFLIQLDQLLRSSLICIVFLFWLADTPVHYAKVVKTRFEVVNFDKSILHQFSTKMSQIFNDGVKRSNFFKNVIRFPNIMDKSSENSKKNLLGVLLQDKFGVKKIV